MAVISSALIRIVGAFLEKAHYGGVDTRSPHPVKRFSGRCLFASGCFGRARGEKLNDGRIPGFLDRPQGRDPYRRRWIRCRVTQSLENDILGKAGEDRHELDLPRLVELPEIRKDGADLGALIGLRNQIDRGLLQCFVFPRKRLQNKTLGIRPPGRKDFAAKSGLAENFRDRCHEDFIIESGGISGFPGLETRFGAQEQGRCGAGLEVRRRFSEDRGQAANCLFGADLSEGLDRIDGGVGVISARESRQAGRGGGRGAVAQHGNYSPADRPLRGIQSRE